MVCTFCKVTSKISLFSPRLQKFSLMFYFFFSNLNFSFRSVIHFKIIIVCGKGQEAFIFSIWLWCCSNIIYLKALCIELPFYFVASEYVCRVYFCIHYEHGSFFKVIIICSSLLFWFPLTRNCSLVTLQDWLARGRRTGKEVL